MAHLPPPHLYHMLGLGATGDLGPYTFYTKANGKLVWFLKAPPKTPPTFHQLRLYNTFRESAAKWNLLPPEQRANWELASKRAHLYITGYNLWTYWQITYDRAAIATVEHQANLKLIYP